MIIVCFCIGISEIELPPMEPFVIDSINLTYSEGYSTLKATLSDIKLFGATDFIFQNIM